MYIDGSLFYSQLTLEGLIQNDDTEIDVVGHGNGLGRDQTTSRQTGARLHQSTGVPPVGVPRGALDLVGASPCAFPQSCYHEHPCVMV